MENANNGRGKSRVRVAEKGRVTIVASSAAKTRDGGALLLQSKR
jgi:hypothetical protein